MVFKPPLAIVTVLILVFCVGIFRTARGKENYEKGSRDYNDCSRGFICACLSKHPKVSFKVRYNRSKEWLDFLCIRILGRYHIFPNSCFLSDKVWYSTQQEKKRVWEIIVVALITVIAS